MNNLKITSTTNTIKIDFGDHSEMLKIKKSAFYKSNISFILRLDYIEINVYREDEINVSVDNEQGVCKVDFVNGVAPTSLEDLFNNLEDLLG